MVQWLRFRVPNAEGTGSVPHGGTKIPHVKDQNKKTKTGILTKASALIPVNLQAFLPSAITSVALNHFFSYPRTPRTHDTVPPGTGLAYGGAVVKSVPANAGDARDIGWIPGLGRFPGEGNAKPFQ